jgi:hypothetical protein
MSTSTVTTPSSSSSSNNPEWKEIKGPDLLIKSIDKKRSNPLASSKDDDDDDTIDDQPKKIQSGDTILLDFIGRQCDSPDRIPTDGNFDGPIFQDIKGWLVTVGEPHCLLRAIEYALELEMHEGETALVFATSKYNLGVGGGVRTFKDYTLPADSSVVYRISATKIVMDTSRLNPYFSIQRALTMKKIANDVYQHEWQAGGPARERAVHLYEKSARAMKTLLGGTYFASVEADHPQRKECQTIMVDSLNNVVAVYMRAKRWNKAREAASTVLKEDSKNVKALFRNAKSAMMDPSLTLEEKDVALKKAENVIVYKDAEEADLRKLRAQWNKKKQQG